MNADQGIRDRAELPHPLEQEEARLDTTLTEPAEPHQMPRDPPAPAVEDEPPAFRAKKTLRKDKEPKDSPWAQSTQGQEWQPQGWSPAPAKRRS
jgi:NADH dehydrogenase [ubiquinone] 1 alpha subcomplex assembly factor 2